MSDDRQELRDRYPGLTYLLMAYFHQDWIDEAETEDEVLAQFAESNGDNVVREAAHDSEALLDADGDDEERLAQVVDLLGGEIYPPGGGITYRDFLEKISSLT